MLIKVTTLTRQASVAAVAETILGSYDNTGSHDSTMSLVMVDGITSPIWNEEHMRVSVQRTESDSRSRPAPAAAEIAQALNGFGWCVQYHSAYSVGGHSRPRWGVRLYYATSQREDEVLLLDCQEVSGIPVTGIPYYGIDKFLSSIWIGWALAHARKRVTLEVESRPYSWDLKKGLEGIEAALAIFDRGMAVLLQLGGLVDDDKLRRVVSSWVETVFSGNPGVRYERLSYERKNPVAEAIKALFARNAAA